MAGSSHTIEPEIYRGVSTLDEPSAAWGWHGLKRNTIQLAGWISVLFMLGYNFGNHKGHVETIWLIVMTVFLVLGLLIHLFEPKLSQVRTITGKNKPVGHVEPDWTYDQATLSGTWADLSDSQLRSINIEPSRVAHLRAADSAKELNN
ncbi:DUF2631 domain-containing protein [Corynebacterium crudilactis]|uniref:DUF2631 domain-containing protein n=1 Tax=Corynebacterium crudilactis TaxID=1652495 RepID=A0A172QUH0_9CORY|nr:DUF2631 domain-containing protein [Corynebacterium crudilactis]ANE04288.1 hypothetical protein ccrud_08775 [Corynebacterium crudilactis]